MAFSRILTAVELRSGAAIDSAAGLGIAQHSYYADGNVNADSRASIDGWEQNDPWRLRARSPTLINVWVMRKPEE